MIANPPAGGLPVGPHRCWSTAKQRKSLLVFLLCMAGLLRIWFALATPAWEAPDEYAHYWYAEQIALNNSLPRGDDSFPTYEAYQPPLYYLAASFLIRLYPEQISFSPKPAPPPTILVILRLFSVVLGMSTIWVCYLIFGRTLNMDSSARLWAVGFMAFLPTFVGTTSSVNNDALVVLFATLCLSQVLRNRWTAKTALLGGLFAGAALLTKMNALVLVPLVLWRAFQVTDYRFSRAGRWLVILGVGWMVGGAILLARNISFYGDILALLPGVEKGSGLTVTNVLHAIRNLSWSFWLAFGRLYKTVPSPAVYLLTAFPLMLISLFGWLRLHRQYRTLLITIILAIVPSMIGSLWYTLSYPPGTMTSWGKNLFPVLPLIAVFITLGWRASFPRFPSLVPAIGMVSMLTGCVWALVQFATM